MSLFKFKCQECGHDVSKLRPAKDIIFDIDKKKPIVCRHCGCKYKMSALADWTAGFFICVIYLPICFLTALLFGYKLGMAIKVVFGIRIDGLYVVLAILIFFLSSLLVGMHFILSMPSLKKIKNEE